MGFIKTLFGGVDEPKIPLPKPSKEAQDAAAAEISRRKQGAGYGSTILSDMAAGAQSGKTTFGQ